MLAANVKAISVDDHVIEPPHLWESRLPPRLREIGPHVVELAGGIQAWAYEDQVVSTVRGNTRTSAGFDDDPDGYARFDQMRPGCYDPKARLDDMDLDGVWAQVGFPDFSRFAGHRFLAGKDKELALLCVQAYNDFVIEEWCATDPERLVPLVIVPLWDVDLAAKEVVRTGAMGARGLAFSENPTVLGLPSVYTDHWEPLWAAVADAGLPVCLHIGSSSRLLKSSEDAPPPVALSFVGANSMMACADWLFSGVLERFPQMSVVLSEGGAGWAPYLLEQAEHIFNDFTAKLAATRSPTELFAEHVYVCMIQDNLALRSLDAIPVDNLLWESDYPHESGSFPNSRALLDDAMRDVPDAFATKIVETNARRLFRI
jgi:predicted TIM-barrel fold metal-dependent hydrolase